MTDAERAFLERLYHAFNERDLDTALAGLHSEVDWPNGMEGGRVSGRHAVQEYWTRQFSLIDPHIEPLGFKVTDDGRITVEVNQVVKDLVGSVLSQSRVEHVYSIEGGLITRMEIRKP